MQLFPHWGLRAQGLSRTAWLALCMLVSISWPPLKDARAQPMECPPPRKTITVGMTVERWPFTNFDNPDTHSPDETTFEYQIISRVCQILEWHCTYRPIHQLDDRITWLNNDEVDVVISKFSVTLQRAYRVRFVFPYYYADKAAIFQNQATSPSTDGGASGLDGASLCIQSGYYLQEEIVKLNNDGKHGWDLKFLPDMPVMIDMLKNGSCAYMVQALDHLASPFAIAVSYNSTNHDDIAAALNILMTTTDSRSILEELEEEFLVDQTRGQLRSNSYVQSIVARQTVVAGAASSNTVLRVGQVMQQSHPFRYYNETTGLFEQDGFENVLMTAICEELRVQCVFIGLESVQERIDMLKSNQVDVVASTFTVTAARATKVRFVEPYYYSSGAQLFVPKRSTARYEHRANGTEPDSWREIIGDGRMCLLDGYYFTPRLQTDADRVTTESMDQMINGARGGKCTLLMQDSTYAYLMDNNGLSEMPHASVRDTMPYGLAVRKDNVELARRLSTALTRLMWDPLRWEAEGLGQSKFLHLERLFVTLQTKGLMEPIEYTQCASHLQEMFLATCDYQG